MAEVHSFPGVFRPELEVATAPGAVLRDALDAGLRDVVIVGRTIGGEVTVWGSQIDADAVIGLLTRGITFLAEAQQENEPPADGSTA